MRKSLELFGNCKQQKHEDSAADCDDADVERKVVEFLEIVRRLQVGDGNHLRRYEHQRG